MFSRALLVVAGRSNTLLFNMDILEFTSLSYKDASLLDRLEDRQKTDDHMRFLSAVSNELAEL